MLSGLLGTTSANRRMHDLFADEILVQRALDFEAALASACAAAGVIEGDHCELIQRAVQTHEPDIESLIQRAHHAGTLAIPLVADIKEAVATTSVAAAAVVHLGSTSQDLADTVLALQCRQAGRLLQDAGTTLCDQLAEQAEQYAASPAIGRTLLRRARPISFGLRAANWLTALAESLARVDADCQRLSVQFGGPVGTSAALRGQGAMVRRHLAEVLALPDAPSPWHTNRTATAALGSSLALVGGTLAKIAQDTALLGQDELGEVSEAHAAGRGGSSAMPDKHNPVTAQQILAACQRLPPLAHNLLNGLAQPLERGFTGWQLELPILAEMFIWTFDALQHTLHLIQTLHIHTTTMQRNLANADVGTDLGDAQALALQAVHAYRSRS